MRLSARWRLTVAYGALFVLAGTVLIGTSYAMVRQRLPAAISIEPFADVREAPLVIEQFPSGVPDEMDPVFGQIEPIVKEYRARTLSTLVRQSLVALAATALGALALGWVVAGRVLRPVRRITDTARRLSNSNLDERIALNGPHDELRELGDSFDAMLDRLQSGFESERRFIANASHELRTPIANQRTVLEVALSDANADLRTLRTACDRALSQTVRQQQLIDALFELTRASRPLERRVTVDLAVFAREAVADADRARDGDGPPLSDLLVHTDLRTAPVDGDPVLLARLVGNLVENAMRHNRPGGFVTVQTGTGAKGCTVSIANSSALELSPSDIPELFAPFRRGPRRDRTRPDRNATGLGLGLSIVRSVADSHGARIDARPVDGGGLAVTVTFAPSGP